MRVGYACDRIFGEIHFIVCHVPFVSHCRRLKWILKIFLAFFLNMYTMYACKYYSTNKSNKFLRIMCQSWEKINSKWNVSIRMLWLAKPNPLLDFPLVNRECFGFGYRKCCFRHFLPLLSEFHLNHISFCHCHHHFEARVSNVVC